ncbi:MAG: hypothetical protein ABIL01_05765 [Pseudomonadota bacterium]
MPRFIFEMQQGKLPGSVVVEDILGDSHAARRSALGICADLARDIANGLADDSEWQLNVLDEQGKRVLRVRLLVEAPEPPTESVARPAPEQRHAGP